jgi:hypothetical protein
LDIAINPYAADRMIVKDAGDLFRGSDKSGYDQRRDLRATVIAGLLETIP